MRLRRWLMLLAVCLSAFFLAGIGQCSNGPKVSVYISNPGAGGMDFANQATGEQGFIPYNQTDRFICFLPTDAETLLNYCGVNRQNGLNP